MAFKVLVSCGVFLWAMVMAGQDRATVAISVKNDARVSERELRKAEQLATHVFHNAGIDVRWAAVDGCEQNTEPLICVVVSVDPGKAEPGGDVFGTASATPIGMGKHVSVFYPSVRALNYERLDTAGVLGYVIAHETGHILLGVNSHAKLGIMQPRWEASQLRRASMGTLLFTPDEAENMRERIRTETLKKIETERRKATEEPEGSR
jgi:hypothetical protein